MRKMGVNKNYVVGIYDDTRHHNLTLDQKRKEITEFFTRFKYFGPIIVKQDINEVLDERNEKLHRDANDDSWLYRGTY